MNTIHLINTPIINNLCPDILNAFFNHQLSLMKIIMVFLMKMNYLKTQMGNAVFELDYLVQKIILIKSVDDVCFFGFIQDECALLGDVNQDEQIDIVDVVTIIQITLEIYEPTETEFILSDLILMDSVDISDIVAIINYILEN